MARRKEIENRQRLGMTLHYVTEQDVADYLDVSVETLRRIAKSDPAFPAYVMTVSNRRRFFVEEINGWLARLPKRPVKEQKRVAPVRETVIYFVRMAAFVKIGISFVASVRLKQLQTGCPEPLELLLTTPGDVKFERRLHNMFAADRVRADGEWFRLSHEILDFIEQKKAQQTTGEIANGDAEKPVVQ